MAASGTTKENESVRKKTPAPRQAYNLLPRGLQNKHLFLLGSGQDRKIQLPKEHEKAITETNESGV
jgi:hypothetical protein